MATETGDYEKKSEKPMWPKACAKCGAMVDAAPYWYSRSTKTLLHADCMKEIPEASSDTEDTLLCIYERLGELLTTQKSILSTLGLINATQKGVPVGEVKQ